MYATNILSHNPVLNAFSRTSTSFDAPISSIHRQDPSNLFDCITVAKANALRVLNEDTRTKFEIFHVMFYYYINRK